MNKVLQAILDNWNLVEGAVQTATNSMGSAAIENEKYLNSIEGKTKAISTQMEKISTGNLLTTFSGEDIYKGFLDISLIILKVADSTQILNVALSSLALGVLVKMVNGFKKYTNQLEQNKIQAEQAEIASARMNVSTQKLIASESIYQKGLISKNQWLSRNVAVLKSYDVQQQISIMTRAKLNAETQEAILAEQGLLTAETQQAIATALNTSANEINSLSLKERAALLWANVKAQAGLMLTNPTTWIFAIAGGMMALNSALDYASKATERLIEPIEKLNQQYQKTEQEIVNVNNELETNKKRIEEINNLKIRSIVQENELIDLKEKNNLLELQLEILKNTATVEKEVASKKSVETYESYISQRRMTSNPALNKKYGNQPIRTAPNKEIYEENLKLASDYAKQLKDIDEQILKETNEYNKKELKNSRYWIQENYNTVISEITTYLTDINAMTKELEYDPTKSITDSVNSVILGSMDSSILYLESMDKKAEAAKLKIDKIFLGESNIKSGLEELGKKGEVTPEIIQSYNNLATAAQNSGITINDLANYFNSLTDNQEKISTSQQEFINNLKSVSETYDIIASAQEEYDKKGYVSIDNYNKLIELSSDYQNVLFNQDGKLQMNEDSWRAVIKQEILKIKTDKELEKSNAEKTISEQTKKLQELEKAQIEAFSEERKIEIDNMTSALKGNQIALQSTAKDILQAEQFYKNFGKTVSELNFSIDAKGVKESNDLLFELEDAVKSMGKLSIDILDSIINKYPQLQDEVTKYMSGLIDSNDLIKTFKNTYIQDTAQFALAEAEKLRKTGYTTQQIEQSFKNLMSNLGLVYNGNIDTFSNMLDAMLLLNSDTSVLFTQNWALNLGIVSNGVKGLGEDIKKATMESANVLPGISQIQIAENIKTSQTQSYIDQLIKASQITPQRITPSKVGGSSKSDSGKLYEEKKAELEKWTAYEKDLEFLSSRLNTIWKDMANPNITLKELISLQKEEADIFDKQKKIREEYLDTLRKTRDEIVKEMSQKYGFSFIDEGDKTRIENYNEVIKKLTDDLNKLYKQAEGKKIDENSALAKQIEQLEKELENAKKTADEFFDLQSKRIPSAIAEWDAYKSKISEIAGTMMNSIDSLMSMTINMLKQNLQNQLTGLNAYKDNLTSIYETARQAREQAKKDNDDAYEKTKKALEDELDMLRKKIQAQRDALKLKQDEYYFDKELREKQRTVGDIESELFKLEGDDSVEAMKRRKELEEELYNAKENLQDFEFDREIELADKALEDELKRLEDLYQAKIDALEKEKKQQDDLYNFQEERERWLYDQEMKRLEHEMQIIQGQINDEYALRQQALALMEGKSEAYYQSLIEWNKIYGTHITEDVVSAWEKAYNVLDSMISKGLTLKDIIEGLAQAMNLKPPSWLSGNDGGMFIKPEYVGEGTQEREENYNYGNNNGGFTLGQPYYSPQKFHEGGIIGENKFSKNKNYLSKLFNLKSDEIPAIMQKDEEVLTERQRIGLQKTMSGLSNISTKNTESVLLEYKEGNMSFYGSDESFIEKFKNAKNEIYNDFLNKLQQHKKIGSSFNYNLAGI